MTAPGQIGAGKGCVFGQNVCTCKTSPSGTGAPSQIMTVASLKSPFRQVQPPIVSPKTVLAGWISPEACMMK